MEQLDDRETASTSAGHASRPWLSLAQDYERARAREDSLDRILEWPAQRALIGDVKGLSVLDVGCGNGSKLAELVDAGANDCVGIDISGNFPSDTPPGMSLIQADLSELDALPELANRAFDRITFLQSIGYAADPVRTLKAARAMLADDGYLVLTRTHPIRYAVERSEKNGTALGEEYYSTAPYTYFHDNWNEQIALTKRAYTISDLINLFSSAGLWIEQAIEPQLSDEARKRYPHKQAVIDKYLSILIFKLRPLPGR